jgi:hypothetical protein
VLQLTKGQLTLNFEGVANKAIGEILRLSTTTNLEEVSEIVKSRGQMILRQRLNLFIGRRTASILSTPHCDDTPPKGCHLNINE